MPIVFYLSYAALWILVIVQGLILVGLVRMAYQLQHSADADRRQEAGREAPAFNAMDLSGRLISSADFAGHLTAVLFVSPTCTSCTATLEDMAYLNYKARGNVLVICRAGHDDCVRLRERYAVDVPIVADDDDRISALFNISSVPTAVLIDESNRMRYGHPMRGEDLEEMLDSVPVAEALRTG